MPELSSAASAANFSTESDAVGAGQFVPESVVSLPWNPWSVSRGIGGQFPPESVVRLDRNTHSESWGPVKQWLLYLRKLGIAVVIVHHAGKNGQQRGTSSREDSLDVVLSLKPQKSTSIEEKTRFNVHFEKARSIVGKDAKPFSLEMSITETGINWQSKPLSSDAVREKKDQRLDQVLKLSADGNTTRAIADATGIPRSTVQRMLKSSTLAAN